MTTSDSILDLIRGAREIHDRAPGTWPAKRELAAAVRELMHCLAATDAPEAELLAIAEQVRSSARRFSGQPTMRNPPGVAEMSLAGGMEVFRDRSPMVGEANPLAPPATLAVDAEQEKVFGEVFFGRAYEGAPGCVHGGFVAAVFDEALGMATELGMVTLEARIGKLRARLSKLHGAGAATTPSYPDGLTDREVEVLRLVAKGFTNNEVADLLHISGRTVATHLRNIYEKTGCANRAEASAYAIREGLAEE